MDFFQTILVAMTTPNELIVKLQGIPLYVLGIYTSVCFFTILLNIQTTFKRKLVYISTFGILGNLITFFIPSSYAIFISLLFWPILTYSILKTTVLKSILSEVATFSITSILDFIFSNIAFNFFHISFEELISVPVYKLLSSLGINITLYLISRAIKYFKINIEVFDNMHKKTKILLITNLTLIILVIAMQFYLVIYYVNTMPILITVISNLVLISYFIVSIYSIINTSKLEVTTRDLEGTKLNLYSLQVLHDTVRTFKHDFDNIINGIGGYIRNEDMEGLTKYYNQLLEDCHKTNNLYSLNPKVINHPAIYNLLATKYYIADELNIQINLDIFLDLNEFEQHMKIYEFTRILGILLDNAIEAAKDCEKKIINVIFRKEDSKHRIVAIIENTYSNKNVDIDKIFEKGVSSKSKETNSGLGLWKIRQILKKNNNLNLFTSKTQDLFKQQFEIYY